MVKNKKIESLSKDQMDLMPFYRDKWLKIGLSTEKSDRLKAEEALRNAYRMAGLSPPKQIIWASSPLSGAIVVSILKNDDLMKKVYSDFKKSLNVKPKSQKLGDSVRKSVWASVWASVRASVRASVGDSVWASVRDSVGDSVWASVWASVWDSVRDSVRDSVGDSVGDSVRDSVRASVGDSVWDSVGDSVRDSVGDSVWDSVRASVGDSVRASVGDSVWASVRASVGDSVRDSVNVACFGQHDAPWLGFYEYFFNVLKLEFCSKLIPLMDLAQHVNWWYPYQDIAVLSEKHSTCALQEGKIHCETGPAIQYPDGFSIWALHGVRVPEWLVMTSASDLNPEKIMKLENAEQRKEGIRKIGIDRMKDYLKVKVIHTFRDYELWTFEFEGRRIGPYLKMVNDTTGQIHVEGVGKPTGGVDETIRTCQEALAWRGGFKLYADAKWTA